MLFWRIMLARTLSHKMSDDSTEMISRVQPTLGNLGELLDWEARTERVVRSLQETSDLLEFDDKLVFVGYDEPDALGGLDRELRHRLARGLIALWSNYGRLWPRIRAKIFLAPEMVSRQTDLGTLANRRVDLKWPNTALLGLLVKRIANTSTDLAQYCHDAGVSLEKDPKLGLVPQINEPSDAFPLLERIAGTHMGEGIRKGPHPKLGDQSPEGRK